MIEWFYYIHTKTFMIAVKYFDMNRRTWLASMGTGCLGLFAGCSAFDPRTEYSVVLQNSTDSAHLFDIKVNDQIVDAQSTSFHNDSYEIASRTTSEQITLTTGTPAAIRVEIENELVRVFPWPASFDSPGKIASNANITFTNDLATGQRVQIFGDR